MHKHYIWFSGKNPMFYTNTNNEPRKLTPQLRKAKVQGISKGILHPTPSVSSAEP